MITDEFEDASELTEKNLSGIRNYSDLLAYIDHMMYDGEMDSEEDQQLFYDNVWSCFLRLDLGIEDRINLLSAIADGASSYPMLYNRAVDKAVEIIDENEGPSPLLRYSTQECL